MGTRKYPIANNLTFANETKHLIDNASILQYMYNVQANRKAQNKLKWEREKNGNAHLHHLQSRFIKKKLKTNVWFFGSNGTKKSTSIAKKNTQITQSIDTTYVSNELLPLPIHIYIVQQYTFVSTWKCKASLGLACTEANQTNKYFESTYKYSICIMYVV